MKFILIDRITEIQPGESIKATKCLSLAEEYLQDHFPRFPVMPGVLMLETMTQTCAWLVRVTEDFSHSVVILQEAKNVKYAGFVEPGGVLEVSATMLKHEDQISKFKVQGVVNGNVAVSARITLQRYNVSGEAQPNSTDMLAINKLRQQLKLLKPPLA
ncbi:MAG: 3-hydroxyacyl-ACP dehydratase FabZ family protein [Pirellulales bacterium]